MTQSIQALLAELEELALAVRERPQPTAEWAVRECIARVARALGVSFSAHDQSEAGPGLFRSAERVVEAARLARKEEEPSEALVEWLARLPISWECERDGALVLQTADGERTADAGDWIVLDHAEGLCLALDDTCFRALYRALPRGTHSPS